MSNRNYSASPCLVAFKAQLAGVPHAPGVGRLVDRERQNLTRNRVWRDFGTGGSRGIRDSHEYVRQGGAAAREVLIEAAAQEWKVPASECVAANSIITHMPSGRSTTYGKVAEAAAKLQPPAQLKLKDPMDWKLAGKGVKRLDTPDKLTGQQVYGIDVKNRTSCTN